MWNRISAEDLSCGKSGDVLKIFTTENTEDTKEDTEVSE